MADFQENKTVRIETFGDGVLAINITLLMFELKAPEFKESYNSRTLFVAMPNQWPAYMAFLLSFSTIFVIWVNHHRVFNMIRWSDARFTYLNGLLLLLTSLIPFATNVLSKYSTTSATELSVGLCRWACSGPLPARCTRCGSTPRKIITSSNARRPTFASGPSRTVC